MDKVIVIGYNKKVLYSSPGYFFYSEFAIFVSLCALLMNKNCNIKAYMWFPINANFKIYTEDN